MKSHTVPQRLLEQFAYQDVSTNSPRLWRYEKGRPPYWKASPQTATSIDGFLANPSDHTLEEQLEKRLAYEIEDPVNVFMPSLADPKFTFSDEQRRQMARYLLLLFNRTRARRAATGMTHSIKEVSLRKLLQDDDRINTIAAHWGIEAHLKGQRLDRLVLPSDVRKALEASFEEDAATAQQEWFVGNVVQMLSWLDISITRGEWIMLEAPPNEHFIISDAPVVTREPAGPGAHHYGVSFRRTDTEVYLPLSPRTCLMILPGEGRTSRPPLPGVTEMNRAQAKVSTHHCFASVEDAAVDSLVQNFGSTVKLGEHVLAVWESQFDDVMYESMLGIRRFQNWRP
jgi:hypothetical protein